MGAGSRVPGNRDLEFKVGVSGFEGFGIIVRFGVEGWGFRV